MDENEYVDVWIRYFKGRGRPYMEQYLARSTRYLPMMKNVMREKRVARGSRLHRAH